MMIGARHRLAPALYPLLVGLALLASAFTARAATYNFYFNGVEQGANSTATPTVTVQQPGDGQPPTVVQGPTPSPAPEVAAPEAAAPPPPASSSSSSASTAVAVVAPPLERHRPFYVMLTSAGYTREKSHTNTNYSWDDDGIYRATPQTTTYDGSEGGVGAEFGMQFSRDFSAGLMLLSGPGSRGSGRAWTLHGEAQFLNGELFHRPNWFQWSALVGVGNVGVPKDHNGEAALHYGSRMRFNLGPDWGLMCGMRGNPDLLLAELAFIYRF